MDGDIKLETEVPGSTSQVSSGIESGWSGQKVDGGIKITLWLAFGIQLPKLNPSSSTNQATWRIALPSLALSFICKMGFCLEEGNVFEVHSSCYA